jgi:hypothetical protein
MAMLHHIIELMVQKIMQKLSQKRIALLIIYFQQFYMYYRVFLKFQNS